MQDKMPFELSTSYDLMTEAGKAAALRVEATTLTQMHHATLVLEQRIRRGCTGCGTALLHLNAGELKPLPGCTVIYRPWTDLHPGEIDFGSPYCGRCLYSMGIACMPGDDYAI
jgi:hypothetical protein